MGNEDLTMEIVNLGNTTNSQEAITDKDKINKIIKQAKINGALATINYFSGLRDKESLLAFLNS